jgi:hypothetical protein
MGTTECWRVEFKQRGGKWAPQWEAATWESIQPSWENAAIYRRKARCVHIRDGVRTVIAKYEPPELVERSR